MSQMHVLVTCHVMSPSRWIINFKDNIREIGKHIYRLRSKKIINIKLTKTSTINVTITDYTQPAKWQKKQGGGVYF